MVDDMKKNGFTLIELLGVLLVLGVIILIAVPSITAVLDKSKDRLYKTQLNTIKEAARLWGAQNIYNLPENDGDVVTISLLQLKLSGFLEIGIKNPKTDKLFPDDMNIVIKKNGFTYSYEVLEDSGTTNEIIDSTAPLITLNGSIVQNVEINTSFVDLGATAKGRDNTSLEVNKVITQNGVDATIDTSKLGTYIITYSATHKGKTTSIQRKVQVIDTKKPVLSCSALLMCKEIINFAFELQAIPILPSALYIFVYVYEFVLLSSLVNLTLYPFSSNCSFNLFAYFKVKSLSVIPSFDSPESLPPCPASITISYTSSGRSASVIFNFII